jgi:hypothetical protein
MSFAMLINIVVAVLCALVVLQSVRMMRNIRDMKAGNLGETVKSLDRATAQARQVLAELKVVLTNEGADNARAVQAGEALRDELSLMVGIGNAVADRIMEAASMAEHLRTQAPQEPQFAYDEALDLAEPLIEAEADMLDAVEEEVAPVKAKRRSRKITTPAHTRLQ